MRFQIRLYGALRVSTATSTSADVTGRRACPLIYIAVGRKRHREYQSARDLLRAGVRRGGTGQGHHVHRRDPRLLRVRLVDSSSVALFDHCHDRWRRVLFRADGVGCERVALAGRADPTRRRANEQDRRGRAVARHAALLRRSRLASGRGGERRASR